jgi:uncharacterized protein DUF4352
MRITRLPHLGAILQTLRRYFPIIALALATCGAILAYISSAGAASALTSASSPVSTSSARHFKVGAQVKAGDTWTVTINSARLHGPTIFDRPRTGDTYLVIDATFKNTSSRTRILSSSLQMSLQAPTRQAYNQTIVTFSTISPDGSVAAGAALRGQLVYEVPKGKKSFVFTFEPDIMNSGQIHWDITV